MRVTGGIFHCEGNPYQSAYELRFEQEEGAHSPEFKDTQHQEEKWVQRPQRINRTPTAASTIPLFSSPLLSGHLVTHFDQKNVV